MSDLLATYVIITRTVIQIGPSEALQIHTNIRQDATEAVEAFDRHLRDCKHASVEVYQEVFPRNFTTEQVVDIVVERYGKHPQPQASTMFRYWADPDPDHVIHRYERQELPTDDGSMVHAMGSDPMEVAHELARQMTKQMLASKPWYVRVGFHLTTAMATLNLAPWWLRIFVYFSAGAGVMTIIDIAVTLVRVVF